MMVKSERLLYLNLSNYENYFNCILLALTIVLRYSEHADYNDVCYIYTMYCLHVLKRTSISFFTASCQLLITGGP